MRVFAHPFRIAADGSAATIEQGTADEARQVLQAILAIPQGSRPLGPEWGLEDPAGVGTDEGEVRGVVELCEPDLQVRTVTVEPTADGRQRVLVDAIWVEDA